MDLDHWKALGQYYDHRGHSIFTVRGGDWSDSERPVLLLIHGFPTASWDFHHQWSALCERFRVITADLIGYGFSAKPRGYPYSILDQADLMEGLLTRFGVHEAHILAHDYGDTVAQEMLARHHDRNDVGDNSLRVQSICFLNGGLFPETHHATRMQKLLHSPLGALVSRLVNERTFRRNFSAVFGTKTKPSDAELAAFWSLITHGGHSGRLSHRLIRYMGERRTNRERWVRALQRGSVPLRVIDGADDPVSGAHMVARYRELVPNPDTVLLPGIGHYPQVEAPQAVLDAVLAFHGMS